MDVRAVLQQARAQARLDQRRLAARAGTARTTVVAYETGAQSPTVRQLDRLLAACGLQARMVLEPLTDEVDQLLDQALAALEPPWAMSNVPRFAASLTAARASWALDGRSAVAAQGLALPHEEPVIALVDDDGSRRWLRTACASGWGRHGASTAPSWYESAEQVRLYVRKPVRTVIGQVQLRFLEEPPVQLLTAQVDGSAVPVLPLPAVRRAHPELAELLDRHEQRSTGRPAGRTV